MTDTNAYGPRCRVAKHENAERTVRSALGTAKGRRGRVSAKAFPTDLPCKDEPTTISRASAWYESRSKSAYKYVVDSPRGDRDARTFSPPKML